MPLTLKSQLSESEQENLARCEATIESGMLNFVETGNALLEVSDKRLYRETHSSFQDYVKEKWNMSARRAYELCEAAEVVKQLDCAPMAHTLTNERQARALAKVPVDQREEVLSKAKAKGKVTAKTIKEAAQPETPALAPDAAWKSAAGDPEIWKPKSEQQIILTALKSNWLRADQATINEFNTWILTQ